MLSFSRVEMTRLFSNNCMDTTKPMDTGTAGSAPTDTGAAPHTTERRETYEMMVIIPATLSDEEAVAAKSKISAVLVEHGANVTEEENLEKRKLAYPIKHVRQGFYHLYKFDAPTKSVAKLDAAYRLMPEVLRHLIVVRTVKTAEQIQAENALREKIMAKRAAAEERAVADRSLKEAAQQTEKAEAAVKQPAHEVTKEELDKKLEEILTDESLGE